MLNKCKSLIPPLFNQFEVLPSSVDEAECFARKLSSRSTLDFSGVLCLTFALRTEFLLYDMHVTPSNFTKLIPTNHMGLMVSLQLSLRNMPLNRALFSYISIMDTLLILAFLFVGDPLLRNLIYF